MFRTKIKTILKKYPKIYNLFIYRKKIIRIDLKNKFLYGINAPVYGERIWINPNELKLIFKPRESFDYLKKFKDEDDISGMVIKDDFPEIENNNSYMSIFEHINIKETLDHFIKGLSWEETGAYERVLKRIEENNGCADGCRNFDDVIKRYKNIDNIFAAVKENKKLFTRFELDSNNFREQETFTIHINQNKQLFLGKGGFHRFGIALVLGLSKVPAQIGLIQKSG